MAVALLSPGQRNYALVAFALVPAAANSVINGLIGWAMFRNSDFVPVWGLGPSVGPDTLGTCFFLPLFTCLVVTPLTWRHVRRGAVEPLSEFKAVPTWARDALRPVVKRAALLGCASFLVVGPVVLVSLSVLGVGQVALVSFLVFKVAFSVMLGLVVTPLIGLLALADPVPNLQVS